MYTNSSRPNPCLAQAVLAELAAKLDALEAHEARVAARLRARGAGPASVAGRPSLVGQAVLADDTGRAPLVSLVELSSLSGLSGLAGPVGDGARQRGAQRGSVSSELSGGRGRQPSDRGVDSATHSSAPIRPVTPSAPLGAAQRLHGATPGLVGGQAGPWDAIAQPLDVTLDRATALAIGAYRDAFSAHTKVSSI